MKRNVLWLIAMLWLSVVFLVGCNSQNVWDIDYDLSTEIWRQLHCYAQFQKENRADRYWVDWMPESNDGFIAVVEWVAKVNDEEYNLKCTYSDDIGDWTIEYSPLNSEGFDLQSEEGRIAACEERAGFYLNFNEWTFTWNDESEGWASFVRNWHVIYLKRWENAEDDVECVVDMVDGSVNVEFSNHIYNGELQEDTLVSNEPVAKMMLLEWQTEEEMLEGVREICLSMWWHWSEWLCNLEDGSTIAF